MARIILVHGWGGSPHSDWFPWLKKELSKKRHTVLVPEMPDTKNPIMHTWIAALTKATGMVDGNTFFVGHSIGCQTILRYLAYLPNQGVAGGVLLVAPWTTLKPESYEKEEDRAIAQPWLETPIPGELANVHAKKFVCFFSDNDYFVFVKDSKIFKEKLGAEIIIEQNRGHYTSDDGCESVPSVLEQQEKMMKK